MIKIIPASLAMLAITFLAWQAILAGINGAVLLAACSAIAGLGGWIVGKKTGP